MQTARPRLALQKNNANDTTLYDLHDNILVKILLRLPLTTVFQCKSVSKLCFSLISSSFFVNRFVSERSSMHPPFTFLIQISESLFFENSKTLLVTCKESTELKLRWPTHIGSIKVIVEASCNDLVLCKVMSCSMGALYYVMNPITRQCGIALPPLPQLYWRYRVGFIHNHDQHNYRVVWFPPFNTILKGEVKVEIFSSETGEWNESVKLCPSNNFTGCGVPYKNLLFWWDSVHCCLIGFDPYKTRRFFMHPEKLELV